MKESINVSRLSTSAMERVSQYKGGFLSEKRLTASQKGFSHLIRLKTHGEIRNETFVDSNSKRTKWKRSNY